MIYRHEFTGCISFPLGGIGSGCVGLAGNGRLIDWEIFNRPAKGSVNGMSHFAVRAERDGQVIDARILHGDLQPPYTGDYGPVMFRGYGWGPTRETMCGLPHFRDHTFQGEYPMARIDFADPSFPGTARLAAWSPLIPGNDVDSSLPAAMFEVEVANTTADGLDYTVTGVLGNPFQVPTAFNRFERENGVAQLVVGSGGDSGALEYGELALSTDAPEVSWQEYWYRGRWMDGVEVYWNDLMTPGRFRNRSYPRTKAQGPMEDNGLLAVHFHLNPGARRTVRFVLTWHVPNRRNDWNANVETMAAENGVVNRWKNWYATRWDGAKESGRYAMAEYDRLRGDTEAFCEALFASTLPEAVLDGVSANISILKSPTCLRLEDGTFYGWEGVGSVAGSCEGSCAHVWNYAQALPFLFPALERSMRESHLRWSVDENGGSHFRLMLPLGIRAKTSFQRPCVDGQFGEVMKCWREWKVSGDDAWLRRWWPTIRKTIAYAWSEENYDHWDPERTGVISGRQHHTLDMELFGPNAWLNGHYLGALKAAAEMGAAADDPAFAALCRELYRRGREWTERHLFNGEYYIQLIDLNDRSQLEPFSRGDHDFAVDTYWNPEHGEIKYQIGEGCGIDMHLPQWYASLYGIGEILDPEQIRSSLQAIYRHNFKPSMRAWANQWRTYCVNDEAGTVICDWPEGRRRPVIPVPYASETMHGFEWAAAAHMIMLGMVEEGMTLVRSIRDRYDGRRRNPWNEFECGSNYARSMASYALLHAFSGFRFDLTRGMIGFAPVTASGDFHCFWSLGAVWGTMSDTAAGLTVAVRRGRLELRELELPFSPSAVVSGGAELAFGSASGRIRFESPVVLEAGAEITARR